MNNPIVIKGLELSAQLEALQKLERELQARFDKAKDEETVDQIGMEIIRVHSEAAHVTRQMEAIHQFIKQKPEQN